MLVFALVGFAFGIIAFSSAKNNEKKIKELEKRIIDLESKN